MAALRVIQVGNSVGVILPRELVAKLGVQKGDTLFASETPEGVNLSVRETSFQEQMTVARRIMRERAAMLRELAK